MASGRIFVGKNNAGRFTWTAQIGRYIVAQSPERGYPTLRKGIDAAKLYAPAPTPTDWNEIEWWGIHGYEGESRMRAF